MPRAALVRARVHILCVLPACLPALPGQNYKWRLPSDRSRMQILENPGTRKQTRKSTPWERSETGDWLASRTQHQQTSMRRFEKSQLVKTAKDYLNHLLYMAILRNEVLELSYKV